MYLQEQQSFAAFVTLSRVLKTSKDASTVSVSLVYKKYVF